MRHRLRVGIDVGGTFTDVFAFDEISRRTFTHKVSSTPDDPHRAPIDGLRTILEHIGAQPADIAFLGLGTTVATNAFLEGKTGTVGLLTTRGFRDLLEIGRQKRPHLYDPFVRKPPDLVGRALRREIRERIAADGAIAVPLDERDVSAAVTYLRSRGVHSVAICFLNAYANGAHEAQARKVVNRQWPEVDVVTSSDVVPEFREYERFASTVINASLVPIVRDYFRHFAAAVAQLGVLVPPLVVSSSGGVVTAEVAAARPIDTLFSGPSGGVSGAQAICRDAGIADFVTFDMGGTSTEVCLVRHDAPQITHLRTLGGYPIRTTSHDIHTIGAGGSSLASVDAGDMLQVGPRSAGAQPGPACYVLGGTYPTVTDANVVLGRLNGEHLLGGALAIDAALAHGAVERAIGMPKQVGTMEAAAAVVALAEANMAQAIRVVSVERGLDPSDYMLIAFGGAGPLHACAVAREVGMAGVLVPPNPGVLCAMGVLTKDLQVNGSRTRLLDAAEPDLAGRLRESFWQIEREVVERMAGHTATIGDVRFDRTAALRYKGQNHELDVPIAGLSLNDYAVQSMLLAFHAAHRQAYGYAFDDKPVEVVTLRLAAVFPVQRPAMMARADVGRTEPASTGRRSVYFDDRVVTCPIYDRTSLEPGHKITGPAIVEQMDTTTVVPPGYHATVDSTLSMRITWI